MSINCRRERKRARKKERNLAFDGGRWLGKGADDEGDDVRREALTWNQAAHDLGRQRAVDVRDCGELEAAEDLAGGQGALTGDRVELGQELGQTGRAGALVGRGQAGDIGEDLGRIPVGSRL